MKRQLSALAIVLCFAVSLLSVTALAVSTDNCTGTCAHEAAIGTTHYDTLEEAVTAAQTGDTIYLLNNVTLEAQVNLPAGVTLDGQGRTIIADPSWPTGSQNYVVVCDGSVTVKNVTIDANNRASGALQFCAAADGRIEGPVTLTGAKELCLRVNASQVTVTGTLSCEGDNGSGKINVGWGTGITNPPVTTCIFDAS